MVSITLDRVSVDFPIYGAESRSLKKSLFRVGVGSAISHDARNRVLVHALRNISLDAREGDRIGLMGHNGAGKSTLLRTIAGIFEPKRGRVSVTGRVTCLFSLNIGIEPEGTGFENIRLRGLAAGMTNRQIERQAAEIADFTELGEYLNFPIYTYSAGMQARLAFAISTSVAPEILLMDEWISAGDSSFVEKARRRVHELIDEVGILVLASHNEKLIGQTCNKIVKLEGGSIKEIEAIDD